MWPERKYELLDLLQNRVKLIHALGYFYLRQFATLPDELDELIKLGRHVDLTCVLKTEEPCDLLIEVSLPLLFRCLGGQTLEYIWAVLELIHFV